MPQPVLSCAQGPCLHQAECPSCLSLQVRAHGQALKSAATSCALCRWLLGRIEGVLVLEHHREEDGEGP